MKVKFMIVSLLGLDKQKYLRKHKIFKELGENVLYQPVKLPNEPRLIKIHNNVRIAADVTFYTHDVIHQIFEEMDKIPYRGQGNCIEINDNVFIGGHSIIIGNVTIGPNAIIGAGSVITKNVKRGTIVAGNPARVIGNFEDLHKKRLNKLGNKEFIDLNLLEEELWKEFYEDNGSNE